MSRRAWAPPLVLLVLATSACGGDDRERFLSGWEHDGRATPEVEVRPGETHCEWDDALILSVVWPPRSDGTPAAWTSFVRDPDGVMADYTTDEFDGDAELPGDVVETGYATADGIGLWLAEDLATAYLVDDDDVEAWPALVDFAVCA